MLRDRFKEQSQLSHLITRIAETTTTQNLIAALNFLIPIPDNSNKCYLKIQFPTHNMSQQLQIYQQQQ